MSLVAVDLETHIVVLPVMLHLYRVKEERKETLAGHLLCSKRTAGCASLQGGYARVGIREESTRRTTIAVLLTEVNPIDATACAINEQVGQAPGDGVDSAWTPLATARAPTDPLTLLVFEIVKVGM